MTYYVNPDVGADTNNGRSECFPFRHVPGDLHASGCSAVVQLHPGDAIRIVGQECHGQRTKH